MSDPHPETDTYHETATFTRAELAAALYEEDCWRVGVPPYPVHKLIPVHWRSLLRRADRIFYFRHERETVS